MRTVLIAFLILSLTYIGSIFTYQYIEYQKTEARLNKAYSSKNKLTGLFYAVFASYNDAVNNFRSYTVDFSPESLSHYRQSLDSLRFYIDSLSILSTQKGIALSNTAPLDQNIHLSVEFARIKKSVDNMIFLAKDSLSTFTKVNNNVLPRMTMVHPDSIVNRILRDKALNIAREDTVVRKKEKLFARIFKAKNDTLISNRLQQQFNLNQIQAIHNQIQSLIAQNESFYKQDFKKIQHSFTKLQAKERQLLQSNYALFDTISNSLLHIKTHDDETLRAAEIQDFSLYKENSAIFGKQVIASLLLMVIMVTLLLYYHYNTIVYERKITAARDYALRTAKEKTSILANVSHDVRTPVNSLTNIVDLLKGNAINNRLNPVLLDSIAQDIHVINETVEDILNLGKLESGTLEIKEEYFSPSQLLSNLVKMQQNQAEKKNLELVMNINIPQDILIKSGSYRIRQIVSNLLSNAIKYTYKGEVKIKACIKDQPKKVLHIEVTDTGKGIALKDQEHIFEQYYMTDLKSKNSFGLGLHISKMMAEQLNGTLTVKSQSGKGSTFILNVPITELKKSPTALTKTLGKIPEDLHIVIVDDNPINNLFVRQALQNFENIHIFQESTDAIAYIKNYSSDIVLTDFKMKGPGGWDILNTVKERNALFSQDTKVIVLTSDESQLKLTGKEQQLYEFDAVMTKPFNIFVFQQIVTNLLKTRDLTSN